jgi:hypothetical protein
MITKEQKDALLHNEAYIDLLEQVYAMRESMVQQLHDVGTDRIQQISGRILSLDDVLTMAGWNQIQLRSQK